MVLTKEQILNALDNQKNKIQGGGKQLPMRYYVLGALKILVRKDVITVQDVLLEFPELDNP